MILDARRPLRSVGCGSLPEQRSAGGRGEELIQPWLWEVKDVPVCEKAPEREPAGPGRPAADLPSWSKGHLGTKGEGWEAGEEVTGDGFQAKDLHPHSEKNKLRKRVEGAVWE